MRREQLVLWQLIAMQGACNSGAGIGNVHLISCFANCLYTECSEEHQVSAAGSFGLTQKNCTDGKCSPFYATYNLTLGSIENTGEVNVLGNLLSRIEMHVCFMYINVILLDLFILTKLTTVGKKLSFKFGFQYFVFDWKRYKNMKYQKSSLSEAQNLVYTAMLII